MIKDLMKQKEQKWVEMERLIERVGVLHGELQGLHREAVRGFPSDRTFPAGMGVGVMTERVKDALLAAIGERGPRQRSLVELAEADTRFAESLAETHGHSWGR